MTYPTTTTTTQGSVRPAEPKPSTWFADAIATAKNLGKR